MSEIFYAILAGVVQGVTEFLPVSSSGHLVIVHDFLGFDFIDNVAFDVVLHWGTLLALVVFFWRDIVMYVAAWFGSFIHWDVRHDATQRIAWYLLAATVPAVIIGYFFEAPIESALRSSYLVATMLIVVGVLLYAADRWFQKVRTIETLTLGGALLIGCAQALALVPGVSRSGITIIAGLSQKLKREAAARFSFLLSMPIVLGAGLKKLIDLTTTQNLLAADLIVLAVGFVSAAIAGYVCIKYFLRFLQQHSLAIFAYYRIVLGILILIILLMTRS